MHVLKQELLLQRAEILQLQAQINPHFLYNSYFMLLEKSNDRIGDIAAKVGFHNSRHFAKVFQQNVGLAPQTYRDHKRK